MDIDWKQLIVVRERQKAVALEAVSRDRRALEASRAQAQAAHEQWLRRVQARSAHWQAMMARRSGSPLSPALLCDAAAGSRALDAQIAHAALASSRAQAMAAQRQDDLDASRGALRAADGELLKARQMQERRQALLRQARERHQEDAAEELAAGNWLNKTR